MEAVEASEGGGTEWQWGVTVKVTEPQNLVRVSLLYCKPMGTLVGPGSRGGQGVADAYWEGGSVKVARRVIGGKELSGEVAGNVSDGCEKVAVDSTATWVRGSGGSLKAAMAPHKSGEPSHTCSHLTPSCRASQCTQRRHKALEQAAA